MDLALIEVSHDRPEQAEEHFKAAITAGARTARREYALFLLNTARPDEALRVAREGADQGDDECYAPIALAFDRLGDKTEARRWGTRAYASGETEIPFTVETDAIIEVGYDAADDGDYPRAIELFSQAIELGTDWVGLCLGDSYQALNDLGKAEAAYRRGWLDGDDLGSGFNLARLLEDEGRTDEACEIYARLIGSGYAKAMCHMARFLYDEGKILDGEALMRRASASTEDRECAEIAAGFLGVWRAKLSIWWFERHRYCA